MFYACFLIHHSLDAKTRHKVQTLAQECWDSYTNVLMKLQCENAMDGKIVKAFWETKANEPIM